MRRVCVKLKNIIFNPPSSRLCGAWLTLSLHCHFPRRVGDTVHHLIVLLVSMWLLLYATVVLNLGTSPFQYMRSSAGSRWIYFMHCQTHTERTWKCNFFVQPSLLYDVNTICWKWENFPAHSGVCNTRYSEPWDKNKVASGKWYSLRRPSFRGQMVNGDL